MDHKLCCISQPFLQYITILSPEVFVLGQIDPQFTNDLQDTLQFIL